MSPVNLNKKFEKNVECINRLIFLLSVWPVEALSMLAGKPIPTTWFSLLIPVSSPSAMIHFLVMILTLYKETRAIHAFPEPFLGILKLLIKT